MRAEIPFKPKLHMLTMTAPRMNTLWSVPRIGDTDADHDRATAEEPWHLLDSRW
jgi:hypothetical protein